MRERYRIVKEGGLYFVDKRIWFFGWMWFREQVLGVDEIFISELGADLYISRLKPKEKPKKQDKIIVKTYKW